MEKGKEVSGRPLENHSVYLRILWSEVVVIGNIYEGKEEEKPVHKT